MRRKTNVIAVMSSKGGVGKTVTTVNLAAALATKFNKKVLAIDTNISTASLGLHLDIFYPKFTIHGICKKNFPMKKAIHKYHENLHVIPASIRIDKKEKNVMNFQKNVAKIVDNYERLLEKFSPEYDLILLDCAPGFNMEAIAAMQVAGGLLLMVNPEYPALVSAVKTVEYAKLLKMPIGGAVLTKTMGKKYEMKKEEMEKALGIKIIGTIPFDKKVPQSIENRKPVVLFRPRSKSSIAYKKLAASLIGGKQKVGFFKKIRKASK